MLGNHARAQACPAVAARKNRRVPGRSWKRRQVMFPSATLRAGPAPRLRVRFPLCSCSNILVLHPETSRAAQRSCGGEGVHVTCACDRDCPAEMLQPSRAGSRHAMSPVPPLLLPGMRHRTFRPHDLRPVPCRSSSSAGPRAALCRRAPHFTSACGRYPCCMDRFLLGREGTAPASVVFPRGNPVAKSAEVA